jgi:hypothetical protein
MKRALVIPALFVVLAVTVFGQANPRLGVWKLNLQKSKFDPAIGPAPQSELRTYEAASGGKTKATIVTVDAKGMKSTRSYTAAYDGKDYPYAGNRNADTLALTGNAYGTEAMLKKAGKVVQIVHNVMAPDGKSFTLTVTNPAKTGTTVEVFDKGPSGVAPMLMPPHASGTGQNDLPGLPPLLHQVAGPSRSRSHR